MENNKEEATFSPSGAEQQEVRRVEGDENVQDNEMNIDSLTPEPNTMTQVQNQAYYLFQVLREQERVNIEIGLDLYDYVGDDNDDEDNDDNDEDNDKDDEDDDDDLYDAPLSVVNHINSQNIGGTNNNIAGFSSFYFQNLPWRGATMDQSSVHVGQPFYATMIHHGIYSGQQWNANRHNRLYHNVDPDRMTYEELCALRRCNRNVSKGLSSKSITLLEQFTYVYDSKDDESRSCKNQNMCTICIDEFEHGDKIMRLPCNHEYHSTCLLQWLRDNKVCPLCNVQINPTSNTPKDSTKE